MQVLQANGARVIGSSRGADDVAITLEYGKTHFSLDDFKNPSHANACRAIFEFPINSPKHYNPTGDKSDDDNNNNINSFFLSL